ncbi:MAG: hypothetical protein A2504_14170 [Bdellovibrionales bacterium RIFOXYD12_FULL_39_22]|nr:MAG: hypothetical protein A2385_04605 [Bdellovibrionales bacterium RIFOXYB1_FULL_39_21]OFZ43429.1 MAG: hypothetical protein A2485_13120 [Bdellovibrionales bacterium RIFOXYC12_FULL_39_17]OFZ46972.1 MAG: hypothetical protein A2404_00180 [Bdellovibrionales bacterium RIFOXYC1_FULL_39_130]OFZ71865.1 MAG: hypothetical protein A2451_14500 [Bdellovibrionales bacterium RIFOXYC2_FULL_39_8]OFZ76169.1 MAG: hypothetical protein A2560_07430 [Bdellovibrionales bacterium RIFOXYD1_FULL_39_84]OFZ94404.1 MAG:
MEQVSDFLVYCIVGNGRVANHFKHYFNLQSIPFKTWPDFDGCQVVLILISDSAISSFLEDNTKLLFGKKVIHFSGSVVVAGAQGFHPLMSFASQLYELESYQKIPFVVEKGKYSFDDIFPRFPNPSVEILPEQKIYYHALCVMAGNFSTLLWQKLFSDFEKKLGISKEFAFPYLQRIYKNLEIDSDGALTGPLMRQDFTVVKAHLALLKEQDEKMGDIYNGFVRAYFPEFFL